MLIATKHKKEELIAPIFEKELGVICFVNPNFDSDFFGTFTGEIERGENPLVTAKLKVEKAMEGENCDLGIASEGSFGNHPYLHFLPADEELLLLFDKKSDATFFCTELSVETNFNAAVISDWTDLAEFARKANFPSHGLILKRSKEDFTAITKGITDWHLLRDTFHDMMNSGPSVFVETDMRAMFNPSRQKVILAAAKKLLGILKNQCPVCQFPGFSPVESKDGLPCSLCELPTFSALSHIYRCQKCGAEEEKMYPNGKLVEDPTFCPWCNP
jgi:hypothetical protein